MLICVSTRIYGIHAQDKKDKVMNNSCVCANVLVSSFYLNKRTSILFDIREELGFGILISTNSTHTK